MILMHMHCEHVRKQIVGPHFVDPRFSTRPIVARAGCDL